MRVEMGFNLEMGCEAVNQYRDDAINIDYMLNIGLNDYKVFNHGPHIINEVVDDGYFDETSMGYRHSDETSSNSGLYDYMALNDGLDSCDDVVAAGSYGTTSSKMDNEAVNQHSDDVVNITDMLNSCLGHYKALNHGLDSSYGDDEIDSYGDVVEDGSSDEGFVESDPSGQYWRYSEILGKGATKTVYKGFDKFNCAEVAWCKATIADVVSYEHHVQALLQEIQILKGINHNGVLKIFASWASTSDNSINFITELCSSSLLSYRMKHRHLSKKAVRSWAKQILSALAHLHSQQPPIIHRDLKCDNILVKSNSTTCLKIADFGSSAPLAPSGHMHTLVGTPEFMAPEMFLEDYNELIDVYSFGMCMVQLITRDYPYTECKNLPEIYKSVVNNVKPKALHRIHDRDMLLFINRCILPVSERPSARELLSDPFFEENHSIMSLEINQNQNKVSKTGNTSCKPKSTKSVKQTTVKDITSSLGNSANACPNTESANPLKSCQSFRVMGKVVDENTVRLRLKIQRSLGTNRDIVFPYDLRNDTPRAVAEEMVRALDYPEADLVCIANLIREEVTALSKASFGPCTGGVVMGSYVHPHQNDEISKCQTVKCA